MNVDDMRRHMTPAGLDSSLRVKAKADAVASAVCTVLVVGVMAVVLGVLAIHAIIT